MKIQNYLAEHDKRKQPVPHSVSFKIAGRTNKEKALALLNDYFWALTNDRLSDILYEDEVQDISGVVYPEGAYDTLSVDEVE